MWTNCAKRPNKVRMLAVFCDFKEEIEPVGKIV
jgi:hypothetical protein